MLDPRSARSETLKSRLAIALLVLGLAVAVPFTPGMVEELRFIGVSTQLTRGVVVGGTAVDLGRRRNGQRHLIEYDYEVEGKRRRATGYLHYASDHPPRRGDALDVSYATSNPDLARPSGGSSTYLGLPTITFWLMALAGLALLARARRRSART